MRTAKIKVHHFADSHNWAGKIEKEHVALALGYGVAGTMHVEFVLAGAYILAMVLTFFAHTD